MWGEQVTIVSRGVGEWFEEICYGHFSADRVFNLHFKEYILLATTTAHPQVSSMDH